MWTSSFLQVVFGELESFKMQIMGLVIPVFNMKQTFESLKIECRFG